MYSGYLFPFRSPFFSFFIFSYFWMLTQPLHVLEEEMETQRERIFPKVKHCAGGPDPSPWAFRPSYSRHAGVRRKTRWQAVSTAITDYNAPTRLDARKLPNISIRLSVSELLKSLFYYLSYSIPRILQNKLNKHWLFPQASQSFLRDLLVTPHFRGKCLNNVLS